MREKINIFIIHRKIKMRKFEKLTLRKPSCISGIRPLLRKLRMQR